MVIICLIDWSEVGVAVELQCLRNCTLSSFILFFALFDPVNIRGAVGENAEYRVEGGASYTIRL